MDTRMGRRGQGAAWSQRHCHVAELESDQVFQCQTHALDYEVTSSLLPLSLNTLGIWGQMPICGGLCSLLADV